MKKARNSLRVLVLLTLTANLASAQSQPKFELRASTPIVGFPSASAILCSDKRLYVMGDDSRHMIVLDERYQKLDSVRVFGGTDERIPRNLKADIESAVVVGKKILLIGSGSSSARERSYLIRPRRKGWKVQKTLDNSTWLPDSGSTGTAVNIEGAIVFEGKLICANRSMKGSSTNFLFVTPLRSVLHERPAKTTIQRFIVPDSIGQRAGVSDLCYIASDDLLLITLSSEDSSDPLEDGAIGISYIGWINGFSDAYKKGVLRLNGIADLTSIDPLFNNHKIEGLCARKDIDNSISLHLVSDNDDGKSSIFSVRMIRR